MTNFVDLKKTHDSLGMYEKIVGFPHQLKEGWEIGKQATLPKIDQSGIENIIVCGLGGSAIGGDLVRTFLTYKLKIPFQVCRHYRLPEFAGPSSLCILSSYSGNTEETLSAYEEAKRKQAQILAITSGGQLKKKAEADGYGVITIPPGYPPRAALGYSFMPMLVALSRLGFCPNFDADIEKTIAFLEKNCQNYMLDKSSNLAVEWAHKLMGKIPIIYSGQDYFDAVAVRFKGQICENSKQLAFFNFFPEFNHNELVGWGLMEPFKDKLIVIILTDKEDHARVSLRMKIVTGIIAEKGAEVLQMESSGPNLLARIFSLVQFGDFASFYLALLNKIDPTPVKVIDFLKKELEKI